MRAFCGTLMLFAAASASERSLLSAREQSGLKCDGDFNSLKAGSECITTFSKATKGDHQLRATEPSVGYANVARQVSEHFGSVSKATKWFGKHTIPAVLGDSHLYVTDRHHHLLAVAQDSNLWDLDITVEVVADFQNLGDNFWPQMRANHYSLLFYNDPQDPFAMPVEVGPEQLPLDWNLRSFSDNVWRSLAAFAGHYTPDESRCYVATCDFFVDYQWAYVFQVATLQDTSLWPESSAAQELYEKLAALPRAPAVDTIDTASWERLGADMLDLCHSESIKDYPLPAIFGMPTLKGWSTVPLPADPVCASSAKTVV